MKNFITDEALSLIIVEAFEKINEKLDNYIVLPSQYLRVLSYWYGDEVTSLLSDEAYLDYMINKEKNNEKK